MPSRDVSTVLLLSGEIVVCAVSLQSLHAWVFPFQLLTFGLIPLTQALANQVCEKVESKVRTTYNEVADELVSEFGNVEGTGQHLPLWHATIICTGPTYMQMVATLAVQLQYKFWQHLVAY